MSPRFPEGVLFDLDGTLLDSAPDMLAVVNAMRLQRDLPEMTLAGIRSHVSRGGRAMITAAFPEWGEDEVLAQVPEFLGIYQRIQGTHGAAFAGIQPLLQALQAGGTRWGIVTNKPEYLARELVPKFDWMQASGVLVGGDSLPEKKPHPLPLLHAAQALQVDPARCVYVGDDLRDIQAARAAGMRSIAALWGYRLDHDDPRHWGADLLVQAPADLLEPDAWPQL